FLDIRHLGEKGELWLSLKLSESGCFSAQGPNQHLRRLLARVDDPRPGFQKLGLFGVLNHGRKIVGGRMMAPRHRTLPCAVAQNGTSPCLFASGFHPNHPMLTRPDRWDT